MNANVFSRTAHLKTMKNDLVQRRTEIVSMVAPRDLRPDSYRGSAKCNAEGVEQSQPRVARLWRATLGWIPQTIEPWKGFHRRSIFSPGDSRSFAFIRGSLRLLDQSNIPPGRLQAWPH